MMNNGNKISENVKFIVEIALNAKEKSMKFNNFVFCHL